MACASSSEPNVIRYTQVTESNRIKKLRKMKKFSCCFRNRSTATSSFWCFGSSSSQEQARLPPADDVNTYDWEEISRATDRFDKLRVVGEGNFGLVYICHFAQSNDVGAAKIQRSNTPDGLREFNAEISTLSRSNHPHVIGLKGQSFGPNQRAIIYDYMSNGSVDGYVSGAKTGLDWYKRVEVSIGVAMALNYVHSELKVVHRDIKLANVLLGQNFAPKLTDFGLASQIVEDGNGIELETEIYPIKGTPGYIAPETEQDGLVSSKSDVYGFGVFLLELFTGKKAFDRRRPLNKHKLADWIRPLCTRPDHLGWLVDPKLGLKFSTGGIKRILHVAMLCVNTDVQSRPNMAAVVSLVHQVANFEVEDLHTIKHRRSIS